LMDIQMPVMDGYKATCIIRDKLHIKTPIIAMTAHAFKGEKNKCIHTGMNDYLPKPFNEIDLLTKISTWASSKSILEKADKTSKKIIDLSFLKKQTKNNNDFILEMISIFKKENPKEIIALENAIKEKNFLSVYKKAHTLRNSISFFGLNKFLDKELISIEKLSRSNMHMDKIAEQFLKVKSVCAQAIAELEMMDEKNKAVSF
jgi:response regulator RpfG family c-di-GMP phosphodiesterase